MFFANFQFLINSPLCITCVWPTDSKCHNFFLIIADLKVDDFFCSTLKFCNNEPGNFESIKTTKEVISHVFFFLSVLIKSIMKKYEMRCVTFEYDLSLNYTAKLNNYPIT